MSTSIKDKIYFDITVNGWRIRDKRAYGYVYPSLAVALAVYSILYA